MTKVLVVDDDALTRASLRAILTAKGLTVVATVDDGDQVAAAVAEHQPDVALIDLRMRRTDGIETIRRLAGRVGAPRCIALTSFGSEDAVLQALEAGAAGFLSKDDDPETLAGHIRAVAEGGGALGADAAATVIRRIETGSPSEERAVAARDKLACLTGKEREVAELVSELTNAQIAARLHMAPDTVKVHVSRALAKLELSNRRQLGVLADRADISAPE